MIWLSFRQARYENIVIAIVLGLFVLLLVPTGIHVASVFDGTGVGACLAHPTTQGALCAQTVDDFSRRFSSLTSLVAWFNLLPGLVGALLAAPFVLELEQGTYRLAWTQSVTRRRWLTTKLCVILAGAALNGALCALLFTWWRHPFDQVFGRVAPNTFDLEGITPFAYTLFAAALVLAIGALTRRTAIAVGAAFGLYIGVRLAVQSWARQHFVTPTHAIWSSAVSPPGVLRHSWVLDTSPGDRFGHPLHHAFVLVAPCIDKSGGRDPGPCLAQHGVYNVATYFPSGSFWTLQAIEAGLFVGVALVLAAVAVGVVRSRFS